MAIHTGNSEQKGLLISNLDLSVMGLSAPGRRILKGKG